MGKGGDGLTAEEAKSILAYGINLCELAKTKQVHIALNGAIGILDVMEKQERIIAQYKKADAFLAAHGWKWENIDG